jgi:hypothetical protein
MKSTPSVALEVVPASASKLEANELPGAHLAQRPVGRRNLLWGWMTMWIGILSGSILMAWSFDGPFSSPRGFEDYADLPRRMSRLAHIAQVMLPLINVLIGRELDSLALTDKWKQICSWSAIIGMIGVPLGLYLGAIVHIQLKYVSLPAVNAMMLSLIIMGVGTLRAHKLRP